MIKKLSVLALAGLIALPSLASAASNAELSAQVEELSEQIADLEEKAEGWDLASRIQISGDIRTRVDSHGLETADHYSATNVANAAAAMVTNLGTFGWGALAPFMPHLSPETIAKLGPLMAGPVPTTYQEIGYLLSLMTAAERKAIMDDTSLGMPGVTQGENYENELSYTTRLRMNMRVKATENIEIKARAVAYKFWGMQTNPNGETEEYTGTHVTDANPYFLNSRSFDGTVARQPNDSTILLDRAFMNWNNIAGQPIWFSIGRRPTTDGPPAQLRMGSDKRLATPVNYMDYPFDGISLGYAYGDLFGLTDGPGRIRFCYGRGFEAGSNIEGTGLDDVDFAGLSWDVYKKGSRFANIQAFGAFNIFNVPGDTAFPSPYELADSTIAVASGMDGDGFLTRENLGNIFHTAAVYMDEIANLNYFVTLGWSHTDPKDSTDEMGISLLSDNWAEPEDQDGYGIYVGARYDLDDLGLKFGAEYNWGSEYWLAFTPGHDDMYSSKLQTRGSVYELYMIYDLPGGEAISKYGKAFMRLGYQHYDYEWSYSGMWLGTPNKIDELDEDPLYGQFYAPAESMDQIYLTLEAFF